MDKEILLGTAHDYAACQPYFKSTHLLTRVHAFKEQLPDYEPDSFT